MSIQEEKIKFEQDLSSRIYESRKLTFTGINGLTIYNCSIPFVWNGKEYIYGRVEKADQWARSWIRLFERTGDDSYTLVKDHMIYQLEDPFIATIHGEMVLGGTHVRKRSGQIDTYYGYFYRGTDLDDLDYFTTGPDCMKDIRLVDLRNGKIGVFSRPRSQKILEKYGSESIIGYAEINSLDELTDQLVLTARPILGLFADGEWGGCNQAYALAGGKIGVIGHQCYSQPVTGLQQPLQVYVNIAFEFDPVLFSVSNKKIIATRACYPEGPAKKPTLTDCAFTSGIVMREDGKADLYSGLSDFEEGRVVVDYPFSDPII